MSFKPEVEVDGKWYPNALVFATRDEAHEYAADLFTRWTATSGYRATESAEPANYSYRDRHLLPLDDGLGK